MKFERKKNFGRADSNSPGNSIRALVSYNWQAMIDGYRP